MNNSYYFSGHDLQGNSLIFRLGKRSGGRNEVWFAVKDIDGNAYFNSSQFFYSNPINQINNNCISALATCIETGKKWAFSFSGKVSEASLKGAKKDKITGNEIDLSFDGIFTASNKIFEFSRHMDTAPLAKSLASEKWSKKFLVELKENHQVHYEQTGEIKGLLILNGRKRNIKLSAIRDHSYGKRDWNYMDRHIWLMALMENGQALNLSMVRYPAVKELQSGYLTSGDRNGNFDIGTDTAVSKNRVICIESATQMDEIECTGAVPEKFDYSVKFTDGNCFKVSCCKELEFIFPFNDGVYTIHEGIGSFAFNGIKGRGIIEFGFNRDKSRWTRN